MTGRAAADEGEERNETHPNGPTGDAAFCVLSRAALAGRQTKPAISGHSIF